MKTSKDFRNNKNIRSIEISSSLLTRNTLLNIIGQAVTLLLGVISIPFIVRGLGTERFGLLSMALVVLGYFTIFDIGLGRATTKFVSGALGSGKEKEVSHIVWTAVTAQAILGIVGGLVFRGITPFLVEHILNIPLGLIQEAKTTFYLLAFSVPILLISSSFRGVLEAFQRFDLINAVKIPANSLTYLLILIGLLLGFNLPGIVALVILTRLGTLTVFVVLNFRQIPKMKSYSGSIALFQRLFSFGGWIMVSNIVNPILVYFDRFLISSLLSMAALAYYSAPYEAVTRLWIFSASLIMTLFPAFSALEATKDKERISILLARSIKYVLVALAPLVILIGVFAREILQIWLGSDFAAKSTAALQILAIGVLINSLSHTPFALLQGVGRPDLPAKFHLLELLVYISIAWFLISRLGITGGAIAWTLRVLLDAILLYVASFKVCRFSPNLLINNGLTLAYFALLVLGCLAYGLKDLTDALPLYVQTIIFTALFSSFTLFFWRNILDSSERNVILKVVKLWLRTENAL